MTKKKRPKGPKPTPEEVLDDNTLDAYNNYLRSHQKKLRNTEREASGRNMTEPPEPNYD
jgi:hypothetical protein